MLLPAQSASAFEYTDCISAEGWGSPNEFPKYYTKLSVSNTVMMDLWGMQSAPFSQV